MGFVWFPDAGLFRLRIDVQEELLKIILSQFNHFPRRLVDVFIKSKTCLIKVTLQSYALHLKKVKNRRFEITTK
jgi:hypothetical protein